MPYDIIRDLKGSRLRTRTIKFCTRAQADVAINRRACNAGEDDLKTPTVERRGAELFH